MNQLVILFKKSQCKRKKSESDQEVIVMEDNCWNLSWDRLQRLHSLENEQTKVESYKEKSYCRTRRKVIVHRKVGILWKESLFKEKKLAKSQFQGKNLTGKSLNLTKKS